MNSRKDIKNQFKMLSSLVKKASKLKEFYYKFLLGFGFRFATTSTKRSPKIFRKLKIFFYEEDKRPQASNSGSAEKFLDDYSINSTNQKQPEILTSASQFHRNENDNSEITKSDGNSTKTTDSVNQATEKLSRKNSIGELLRESRIGLEWSIEKISLELRVSPKDIIALENDEIERISKNIYAIGFINSYSKMLLINPKIIESKLREIDLRSNTENKVYNLVNIGKSYDLRPSKDVFVNSLLTSLAVLALALIIFSKIEDKSTNISNHKIISELETIQLAKEARQ